jgi:voltage-gated potassium channel Kch
MNETLKSRIKNAIIWATTTIAVSLILTVIMAEFERGVNQDLRTWQDIIWWWVVTIAGVGYGDILPITPLGRIFGGLVIISSLFLLAIVISEMSGVAKMLYEYKSRGAIKITYSGHIVIYGYTSLTAGVIKLLRTHYGSVVNIVLISNDIDNNPFPDQVDFLHANPLTHSTYVEANVENAAAVIVLANDRFNDPDAYSLVIVSGAAEKNNRVISLVELVNEDKKELFKETYIDGFISRKELLKDLVVKDNKDSKLIRVIDKETRVDEEAEKLVK